MAGAYGASAASNEASTTRKERNFIYEADKAFNSKNYVRAIELYNSALQINPQNEIALYNLAVAMTKRADEAGGAGGNEMQPGPSVPGPSDEQKASIKMKVQADSIFTDLYKTANDKKIRENSIYNAGNLRFSAQDYQGSIDSYKRALRLNPANNSARHNLRLAQLHLQQQNQDKDKDQKQDQDKDKDKDQQQDQQQQQQQQQQQEQQEQPQQQQNFSNRNSEQILNAAEQAEAATRRRKENEEKKQIPVGRRTHQKPW